jgi:hypothetical protein
MSMLRLLSTGKSLVGLKHSPARYRLGDSRALPKFNPGKNPFLAKAALQKTEPSIEEGSSSAASPAPDRLAVVSTGSPGSEPSVSTASPRSSTPFSFRSLLIRLFAPVRNCFRRKTIAPVTRKLTSAPRLAIQGELSLDAVKVVRNDLSDGDLEIVPARQSAPGKTELPAHRKQSLEMVTSSNTLEANDETVVQTK